MQLPSARGRRRLGRRPLRSWRQSSTRCCCLDDRTSQPSRRGTWAMARSDHLRSNGMLSYTRKIAREANVRAEYILIFLAGFATLVIDWSVVIIPIPQAPSTGHVTPELAWLSLGAKAARIPVLASGKTGDRSVVCVRCSSQGTNPAAQHSVGANSRREGRSDRAAGPFLRSNQRT
eukprot:6198579-Pleurochrysis_carterae.AAC.2